MHLEAVLFDVDGTLVDSNDAHVRCWIEAFAHYEKTFDYDTVFHQVGKGGDLLVPDLLNAKEMRAFGDELKKHRSKLYKDKYLPHVRPFPGVRELFEALHGRGVALALASSSDPAEVEHYRDLLGVGDLLDGSTSKGDAKMSKPSPEIFEAALEQTGKDGAKTLIVGDTPYDILAAHRMAVAIAAVLSGGFERELLARAEFLFGAASDLLQNLETIDEYFAA